MDDHPRCCDECGQKLDRAYKPHETTCGACLNVREDYARDDEGGTAAA